MNNFKVSGFRLRKSGGECLSPTPPRSQTRTFLTGRGFRAGSPFLSREKGDRGKRPERHSLGEGWCTVLRTLGPKSHNYHFFYKSKILFYICR